MLNIKKIRPMANYLVTTKDTYSENEAKQNGLMIKTVGSLKEYQTVVAVGPMVRGIQVGDLVCINPKRYARYKHESGSLKDGVIKDNPVVSYNFNVIDLDHKSHLLLVDQDIDFVIEDWTEEKEPTESSLIIPETNIIV